MKVICLACICLFVLALSSVGLAQGPLPVLHSSWQPTTKKAEKAPAAQTGPAKQIMADDTVIARTNREFQTDHPDNPSDQTPDGRRAMIEKNEQEAKTPQPQDTKGFTYRATVRNDSDKTVKIVFWEYKFTDKGDPKNVVRRQFLCSVNIQKGAEFDLTGFSTLSPTDAVDAKTESLGGKQFDEVVRINRIEYGDDDILQRGDWKFADVKTAVEHAISTPWGKEICRPL